jgi:uncharacterized membrane protein
MRTTRLEAFSDGVLAIVITIMVLAIKVPEDATYSALGHSASTLLTYLLSFVFIGIYWSNHHHMFQVVERVTGAVLWANLHLLFWLSLFPASTEWMAKSHFASPPLVVYGVNLLFAAISYYILQLTIIRSEGEQSRLKQAIGRDAKGKLSPVLYVAGIAISIVAPLLGLAVYTVVAVMWLVPDRRMERLLEASESAT